MILSSIQKFFKKCIPLCLIMFCVLELTGQYSKKAVEAYALRWGVRAGMGAVISRAEVTYIGNERDYIIHEIALSQTTPMYNIGLFAQKKAGWLYMEASSIYSTYGMKYNVTSFDIDGNTVSQKNENFHYIDLQMMGGLISNDFRLGVGPIMHILVTQNSELNTLANYNQRLRNISYGFSFDIGYNYKNFGIDLKYDLAFRTIGDHIYYRYKKSGFRETPDALSLTLSFALYNEVDKVN